ncbi:MAG: D-Ala-D-Ala carboxypeptidase family metallohydrolase [Siculibacillus sp.]|nr:D-Ala-D-Ala carboxypeptidase family metallohydrolase [Siculibacillus sp.]
MSDPTVPVERGLRATVRMAAGINIGEVPALTRGERVKAAGANALTALRRRSVAFLPDLSETFAPAHGRTVLRYAGLGAAAGSVIVTVAFAAVAAHAALTAEPPADEVGLAIREIADKADRLPLPLHVATTAATIGAVVPAAGEMPRPTGGTYETAPLAFAPAGGTYQTASLAFAPAGGSAGNAAIDRVIDAPPIGRSFPIETTVEDEEDDEAVVPLVLPMPRARPNIEPTLLPVPVPVPRPRPVVLASLTSPNAVVEAPARPAQPEERPSNGPLGFFSSPTDPVKPPAKNKIDTPFGVPYVLQTGSVETACLKPELVDILRRIEGHYHQKVVITSGYRDRGRQGSLHRQCAAADIEIPGVTSQSLASFARTIPGIGGVGTYCHSSMIHVDIGTPRDWQYGCGSYFALRGAPGSWGKVPGALAKAQGTGAPRRVASDADGED